MRPCWESPRTRCISSARFSMTFSVDFCAKAAKNRPLVTIRTEKAFGQYFSFLSFAGRIWANFIIAFDLLNSTPYICAAF